MVKKFGKLPKGFDLNFIRPNISLYPTDVRKEWELHSLNTSLSDLEKYLVNEIYYSTKPAMPVTQQFRDKLLAMAPEILGYITKTLGKDSLEYVNNYIEKLKKLKF